MWPVYFNLLFLLKLVLSATTVPAIIDLKIISAEVKKYFDKEGIEKPSSKEKTVARKLIYEREEHRQRADYEHDRAQSAEKDKNRAEQVILEVSVVLRLRRMLETFLDKHCKMVQPVRDAEKTVPNPPDDAIPTRLIRGRDESVLVSDRKKYVKYISTFRYVYRQVVAILEHSEKLAGSPHADIEIFKTTLKEYNLESKEAIGLAVASLNSELSENVHDDDDKMEMKVDWNDEEKIIDALKFWKIDEHNTIIVARALHRMKSVRSSS